MFNKIIGNLIFSFSRKVETWVGFVFGKSSQTTALAEVLKENERLEAENKTLRIALRSGDQSVLTSDVAGGDPCAHAREFSQLALLLSQKLQLRLSSDQLVAGQRVKLQAFQLRFDQLVERQLQAAQILDSLVEHSARMSRFICLLRDVATQVNHMALNAAIEVSDYSEKDLVFFGLVDEVIALAEGATTAITELDGLARRVAIPERFLDMEKNLVRMKLLSQKLMASLGQ